MIIILTSVIITLDDDADWMCPTYLLLILKEAESVFRSHLRGKKIVGSQTKPSLILLLFYNIYRYIYLK